GGKISSVWKPLAVRQNTAGEIADQAQLRFLLRDRHRVGILTRREPALWAERKPLQRHDLGRLAKASLDRGRVFKLAVLSRYKPQHHNGVGSHVLERRTITRARAVVLQQQR